MDFDKIRNIPKHQTCTYARIVVVYQPQNKDKTESELQRGGNIINYSGKLTTITADVTTSKLIWNSVISTLNTHYMCVYAENFYLATRLNRPEYM